MCFFFRCGEKRKSQGRKEGGRERGKKSRKEGPRERRNEIEIKAVLINLSIKLPFFQA